MLCGRSVRVLAGLLVVARVAQEALAQTRTSVTCDGVIAGAPAAAAEDGVDKLHGQLSAPAVTAIAGGETFVCEARRARVLRVDASGTYSVVAGGGSEPAFDTVSVGGVAAVPATALYFAALWGMALQPDTGAIFVSDTSTYVPAIYRIDAETNSASIIAGSGDVGIAPFVYCPSPGTPAPGAPLATDVPLNLPSALRMSRDGSLLYVCEEGANSLRLLDLRGGDGVTISTVIGTGARTPAVAGTSAAGSSVATVTDVAIDPRTGDVVLLEYFGSRVLRIAAATNIISVVAGTGVSGQTGDGGPALLATLQNPYGIDVSGLTGDVFVSCIEHVRKIAGDTGIITTIAGQATLYGAFGDGGPATSATFSNTWAVRLEPDELGLLVPDADNSNVRRVDLRSGIVTTVMGDTSPRLRNQLLDRRAAIAAAGQEANSSGVELGLASALPVTGLWDVVVDDDGRSGNSTGLGTGDVYLSAGYDHTIIRIDGTTTVATVIAGVGSFGFSPRNGTLRAIDSPLAFPAGLRLLRDADGVARSLVFVEQGSNVLRRLNLTSGEMTTMVGNGSRRCWPALAAGGAAGVPVSDSRISLSMPAMVDVHIPTGDLYWTEERGCVIRRLARATQRVHHVAGICSCGYSPDGALALTSPLASPQGLAVHANGTIYFTDGDNHLVRYITHDTGRIMTLLGAVGSYGFDDGAAAATTLANPYGLLLLDDDSLMFTSSDAGNGAIRRYSALTGNTTTLNVTVFAPYGMYLRRDTGSLLATDGSGNQLRIVLGVASPAADVDADERRSRRGTLCPAGYTCPCGSPQPCTNPATFCPTGSPVAIPVSAGYYAWPEGGADSSAGGGLTTRLEQLVCPASHYCQRGERWPCAPGRYGTARRQAQPAACVSCPQGRYNADLAQIGATACLRCPAGTATASASAGGGFSCVPCAANTAQPGQGSVSPSNCTACAAGQIALPGSTACIPQGRARASASGSIVTLQLAQALVVEGNTVDDVGDAVVERPASTTASLSGLALVAVIVAPIVFIALLPALLLTCTPRRWAMCCAAYCRCCGVPAMSADRVIRRDSEAESEAGAGGQTWGCACCRGTVKAVLHRADQFGLRHYTAHGRSPIKEATSAGGAMTVLALGVIVALAAALVVQYRQANSLVQVSVLPVTLATLQDAGTITSYRRTVPAFFAPGLLAGLQLSLSTMGAQCGNVTVRSMQFLVGAMRTISSQVASNDSDSGLVRHVFGCDDCVLGPLSRFEVVMPRTCRVGFGHVAAVGSTGSVSLSTFVWQPSTLSSPNDGTWTDVAAVTVSITATMEVVHNRVYDRISRGWSVAVDSVSVDTALADGQPAVNAITTTFHLAAAAQYVATEVQPIITVTQLVSSIIGLSGILGAFAMLFAVGERAFKGWCSARALKRASSIPPQTPADVAAAAAAGGAGAGVSQRMRRSRSSDDLGTKVDGSMRHMNNPLAAAGRVVVSRRSGVLPPHSVAARPDGAGGSTRLDVMMEGANVVYDDGGGMGRDAGMPRRTSSHGSRGSSDGGREEMRGGDEVDATMAGVMASRVGRRSGSAAATAAAALRRQSTARAGLAMLMPTSSRMTVVVSGSGAGGNDGASVV